MAAEPLIFIIDDDASLRAALVRLVRSFGYRAHGFASAEDFIDADVIRSCSCVITDIHMPGMSGIELKRVIDGRGCSVPFIMITARAEPELERSALASGALCFLRKPIDSRALVQCIESVLGL